MASNNTRSTSSNSQLIAWALMPIVLPSNLASLTLHIIRAHKLDLFFFGYVVEDIFQWQAIVMEPQLGNKTVELHHVEYDYTQKLLPTLFFHVRLP
ncbi:hypothetical protein PanWU01x14_089220 [Parasponia andersonii]|uniref:Uncharacterized protein n=1 Tax=Parasponia andersonii TaxID=3476 RepID=A0A2P5D7C0_PARAD|nr:hypothetical protein PanWU01x14_089220 [Parasponia andersonii]